MGHIISSIKKNKNRIMQNQKAKNSCENDMQNNIIDAYDEHGIGKMFKMEFMTDAKREGHKSKKENIQLQAMDSCQGRNSSDKERYMKVLGNGSIDREKGYDDVISHLKLVISTARGEDIPLKCYKNHSIKSKSVGRRAKIQTTVF